MRELLVIGLFVILRNMALKFSSVSESPNWPCGRKGGLKERGGGYVKRFYCKCFIEYPNTHQS